MGLVAAGRYMLFAAVLLASACSFAPEGDFTFAGQVSGSDGSVGRLAVELSRYVPRAPPCADTWNERPDLASRRAEAIRHVELQATGEFALRLYGYEARPQDWRCEGETVRLSVVKDNLQAGFDFRHPGSDVAFPPIELLDPPAFTVEAGGRFVSLREPVPPDVLPGTSRFEVRDEAGRLFWASSPEATSMELTDWVFGDADGAGVWWRGHSEYAFSASGPPFGLREPHQKTVVDHRHRVAATDVDPISPVSRGASCQVGEELLTPCPLTDGDPEPHGELPGAREGGIDRLVVDLGSRRTMSRVVVRGLVAGSSTNELALVLSTDGVAWTEVERLPIDEYAVHSLFRDDGAFFDVSLQEVVEARYVGLMSPGEPVFVGFERAGEISVFGS